MAAIPIRTCIACGRKAGKDAFIRVARTVDGRIDVDADGRGAYICLATACVEKAFRKSHLARRLHITDEAAGSHKLKEVVLERVRATLEKVKQANA